ncbi:hypothetical protein EYC80_002655 [Monilinia laxa]|uniref:Uncharacterized protein n=1 Tax=Monilinia laxa TaxID=61186 RepID=A0A5N6K4L9_MONLA|nr:hypothetical protein EYC80_002655 [Monilinia laxa]
MTSQARSKYPPSPTQSNPAHPTTQHTAPKNIPTTNCEIHLSSKRRLRTQRSLAGGFSRLVRAPLGLVLGP